MSQPDWEFLANLGDNDPLDHGGFFIYRDKTGVYPEEAELLEVTGGDREDEYNDDGELISEGNERWKIHRFILEKCTYINGILSDNSSHPELPAWFADDLQSVCDSMDWEMEKLIRCFCSDNPVERAKAYRAIGDHHGYANLDQYPLEFDSRRELEKRYQGIRPQSF